MTQSEYMRAVLDFQKKQRPLLARLEDLLMRQALAKLGASEPIPEGEVAAVILEHRQMLQKMVDASSEVVDA